MKEFFAKVKDDSIIIPKECMELAKIKDGDDVIIGTEIYEDGGTDIIISKLFHVCALCESAENLIEFKPHQYVCQKCVDSISYLKRRI